MPGPLIPFALLAAAFGANELADKQVERERGRRIREETMRQRQLGQEADATLRAELASQTRPAQEAEKNKAVAQREAKYETALPSMGEQQAAYQTTPSAPREVKSEIARNIVSAIRRGRQQGKALAQLGGQGDANLQGNIDLTRGAQQLNRIGGESRASSNILPFELNDANAAGEGWRTVGDLANAGSLAYGLYGMTTPPASAAYAKSLKNPLFAH